jgi:hypothetical protein
LDNLKVWFTRRRRAQKVVLSRPVLERLESRRLLSSTLFVDAAAPGPAHDGSSWADAFTDLQSALRAATAGTTIDVAQGTYKPTTDTNRNATIQLIDGVTLEGGFAGNIGADPNLRNTTATPTILSGDIGAVGNNSDNSYSVVNGGGTDATAVLDGFIVTGGNGDVGNIGQAGGGIDIVNGTPIISDCTFTGNFGIYGGGLCSHDSSPTITDCLFSNNSAGQPGTGGGGAIFETGGSPTALTVRRSLTIALSPETTPPSAADLATSHRAARPSPIASSMVIQVGPDLTPRQAPRSPTVMSRVLCL